MRHLIPIAAVLLAGPAVAQQATGRQAGDFRLLDATG